MTELKWVCTECSEGSGLHLNPKYYYWELLHPETREPVAPGEPGVLVFSHIGWRGTVLVRFWTGDLIKGGARWDRCSHCGYMFPRIFPPICRADKDFTKIRGTRVDLSVLVTTVRDTPGVRQCQILLDHEDAADEFSRDVVTIHVAPEAGASRQDLEERLIEHVKAVTELTPNRIVFEEDEAALEHRLFAKNGIKAEYLVDRRRRSTPDARVASLVLERLDERAAHGRLGRTHRGKKRHASRSPVPQQRDHHRIGVAQLHARIVPSADLELVVELDGAEREPDHHADDADSDGFQPDRRPDLVAEAADRAQDAELAAAIGDRHGQRVDDAQHGDQNRHHDLDPRHAEPLIRQIEDVAADLRVEQDEQSPVRRHPAKDLRSSPPPARRRAPRRR